MNRSTMLLAAVLALPAFGGIPHPDMLLYGRVQTPEGIRVTNGNLRFSFDRVRGGATVDVDAALGDYGEGLTFVARVPVETAPVASPSRALALNNEYLPRVRFNGALVMPTQLGEPLVPLVGMAVGPLVYVVAPTGPMLAVSADVDFGFVLMNTYADRAFEVRNAGAETLSGTARMARGTDFRIVEGGITQSHMTFDLGPGQAVFVTVRFWPLAAGTRSDTLLVRTNAGDEDRVATGRGGLISPTPSPTDTATATPSDTPTGTLVPPSGTPTNTPIWSPTPTSSPTDTATDTPTQTPTDTASATPSDTPSPLPTIPDGALDDAMDFDRNGRVDCRDIAALISLRLEGDTLELEGRAYRVDWRLLMQAAKHWDGPSGIQCCTPPAGIRPARRCGE